MKRREYLSMDEAPLWYRLRYRLVGRPLLFVARVLYWFSGALEGKHRVANMVKRLRKQFRERFITDQQAVEIIESSACFRRAKKRHEEIPGRGLRGRLGIGEEDRARTWLATFKDESNIRNQALVEQLDLHVWLHGLRAFNRHSYRRRNDVESEVSQARPEEGEGGSVRRPPDLDPRGPGQARHRQGDVMVDPQLRRSHEGSAVPTMARREEVPGGASVDRTRGLPAEGEGDQECPE